MYSDYRELFLKYYSEYKTRKYILCPAFKNEPIFFLRKGFHHLLYKNNKRRSAAEIKSKLELLKYVSEIIETCTRHMSQRKINSEKEDVNFWSLEKRIDDKNVVVIIRQINQKPKHFFSVMEKIL